MRKSLLVMFVLLCTTWMLAQTGSSSSQSSSSDTQTTVTGCLSGSSGNYTLTDKSGTAYQLTGDTASLKDHVGHEISVTGAKSSSSSSSSSGSASSSTGNTTSQNTINVSSMKHISETCTSSH